MAWSSGKRLASTLSERARHPASKAEPASSWWQIGASLPKGRASIALDEPEPHFLIVTYGLSAPHVEPPGEGLTAGLGFELTLRVARDESERENLPEWTRSLLEHLASYAGSSSAFEAGENLNLVEPITKDSRLESVLFALDAVLPSPLDGPDGAVTLLQCVLLARDEYDALRAWQSPRFTDF